MYYWRCVILSHFSFLGLFMSELDSRFTVEQNFSFLEKLLPPFLDYISGAYPP